MDGSIWIVALLPFALIGIAAWALWKYDGKVHLFGNRGWFSGSPEPWRTAEERERQQHDFICLNLEETQKADKATPSGNSTGSK